MNHRQFFSKLNSSPYQPQFPSWLSIPTSKKKMPFKEYLPINDKALLRYNSMFVAQKLREFERQLESAYDKKARLRRLTQSDSSDTPVKNRKDNDMALGGSKSGKLIRSQASSSRVSASLSNGTEEKLRSNPAKRSNSIAIAPIKLASKVNTPPKNPRLAVDASHQENGQGGGKSSTHFKTPKSVTKSVNTENCNRDDDPTLPVTKAKTSSSSTRIGMRKQTIKGGPVSKRRGSKSSAKALVRTRSQTESSVEEDQKSRTDSGKNKIKQRKNHNPSSEPPESRKNLMKSKHTKKREMTTEIEESPSVHEKESKCDRGEAADTESKKSADDAQKGDAKPDKTSLSLSQEVTPLKGILKNPRTSTEKSFVKEELEDLNTFPLDNVGICTAQPETPEWNMYWEKYDRAMAEYKEAEKAFFLDNPGYKQDIEKYKKEAARISLEDAIFRQSIGLKPRPIHEVIGHPITVLTTLNGYIFDRTHDSHGLPAYLSSLGTKGFRLEIDIKTYRPESIKVETEYNLLKVQAPYIDKHQRPTFKTVVIGIPPGRTVNDLEVNPISNGWLVVETKEKS